MWKDKLWKEIVKNFINSPCVKLSLFHTKAVENNLLPL